MRLFLANTSNQRQVLYYRTEIAGMQDGAPKWNPPRQQAFKPGEVSPLGGDMPQEQVAYVVEQLARFGGFDVEDVKKGALKGVVPYVFDYDKPVTPFVVEQVRRFNRGEMVLEAKERRKQTALAAANTLGVDCLEISVEQDVDSGLDEQRVEEGFRVSSRNEGDSPPNDTKRGKSGTRKAA
jgi:hypothetical protein